MTTSSVSARKDRRRPLDRWQLLLAILAISFGSRALAQTAPAGTNNPQPFFYPAPPQGFDAVGALDADLATYGFPPRPPAGSESYTRWAGVMANARHRLANPVAQKTGISHGPPQGEPLPGTTAAGTRSAGGAGTRSYYNWSGVNQLYSSPYFAQNNSGYGSIVVGGWAHPTIGSENCSFAPYKMWTWVGMDGSGDAITGNDDVLQAGFAAEACPTNNYAWYEWYTKGCTADTAATPCSAWSVNLPVNPGDYLYVTVTYKPNSQYKGSAFLQNQSTGQYITIGYNQPPGPPSSAYQGYSAEWIVERPCPNAFSCNSYSDLANYYLPNTPNNWFWLYPDYLTPQLYYTPAGADPAGTYNVISMYCVPSNWNPSSACQPYKYISDAYYWGSGVQPPQGYGNYVLYFYAMAPAKQ